MTNYKKIQLSSKAQCASSIVNSSQNRCFAVGQPCGKSFKTCTKKPTKIDEKSIKKVVPGAHPKQDQKKVATFCEKCFSKGPPGAPKLSPNPPPDLLGGILGVTLGPQGSPKAPTGGPERPPDPKNRSKSPKNDTKKLPQTT